MAKPTSETTLREKRKKQTKKVDQRGITFSEKGQRVEKPSPTCELPFTDDRLEAVLKFVPLGVLMADRASGKITYANNRAVELFGINPFGLRLKERWTNRIKMLTADGEIYPPEKLISIYHSPTGSILFTGLFRAYIYRFTSPPANPMGSLCKNLPAAGS